MRKTGILPAENLVARLFGTGSGEEARQIVSMEVVGVQKLLTPIG